MSKKAQNIYPYIYDFFFCLMYVRGSPVILFATVYFKNLKICGKTHGRLLHVGAAFKLKDVFMLANIGSNTGQYLETF